MIVSFVKVVCVALALGLDVFAVCIGVGMRDLGIAAKLRVGAAFATAEVAMTLIGSAIGSAAGALLGDGAGYIGYVALVGVGIYIIRESGEEAALDLSRGFGLLVGALSISLDSLGIGFSIRYIGVPFAATLIAIGCVSVIATTLGLALGRMLGLRVETRAAEAAGAVLILTGAGMALAKVLHLG